MQNSARHCVYKIMINVEFKINSVRLCAKTPRDTVVKQKLRETLWLKNKDSVSKQNDDK